MDIVERLRRISPSPDLIECEDLESAADEIERLRAEVERMRRALDRLVEAVNGMSCGSWIWQTEVPNAMVLACAALSEKENKT